MPSVTVRVKFATVEEARAWFLDAREAGTPLFGGGLRHVELGDLDIVSAGAPAEVPLIVSDESPRPRAWVVEPGQ